jgi:hypothetical protein
MAGFKVVDRTSKNRPMVRFYTGKAAAAREKKS